MSFHLILENIGLEHGVRRNELYKMMKNKARELQGREDAPLHATVRTLYNIDNRSTKRSHRGTIEAVAGTLALIFPDHTQSYFLMRLLEAEEDLKDSIWAQPPKMPRGTLPADAINALAEKTPRLFALYRRSSQKRKVGTDVSAYRVEPVIILPPDAGQFPALMAVKGLDEDRDSLFHGHAFINTKTLSIFFGAANSVFGAVFRSLSLKHSNSSSNTVFPGHMLRQASGDGDPISLSVVLVSLPALNEGQTMAPVQYLVRLLDAWSEPNFRVGEALTPEQREALDQGLSSISFDEHRAIFKYVARLPGLDGQA